MIWFLGILAVIEFVLLRRAYMDVAEYKQENAVLKLANRRLNEQVKIAARPAVTLDESLKRMHSGEL